MRIDHFTYALDRDMNSIEFRIYNLIGRLSIKNRLLLWTG